MNMALVLFLCIACTILLYILYFSREGHYGFMEGLLLHFIFSGVQQLWCACVSYISETWGCTDVFKSVYFEIMTGDLGNNLNVFIVFYWNKSFKLFVSTVWKVHSHFWHQDLRLFGKWSLFRSHQHTWQIWNQHRGYSNYLRSNQLHSLSGNWCTIEQ